MPRGASRQHQSTSLEKHHWRSLIPPSQSSPSPQRLWNRGRVQISPSWPVTLHHESPRAEGIFRLTAENSEEQAVTEQVNRGFIPERIDVHCLAGLIKAWFRELPTSVLDVLSPEKVMQCQTEEEYVELVNLLPPTEAYLLDWAINIMADVVQYEYICLYIYL
ncbi:unnamed protein product [Eruca vesicaria subsp. sativa]|uniref:Rho-GAP domain-containing protein n=1 Tax=Eruca vesicaria subsp. sativa TaxID=29727 RepID=A0ABC8M1E0_ERUVS|nr:unnamed protein product [Eruca vesicaria subsp. sativa]